MSSCSILRTMIAGVVVLCGIPLTALAGQASVNVQGGIAIQGYDPVAYFIAGEPRKGRSGISAEYKGVRWLFSSEANKRRFMGKPERFLPAYGGYCAYGIAQGHLQNMDPRSWTILYDRLYLNCPEPIYDLWLSDPMLYIRQADRNWPRLSGQIGVGLQAKPSKDPALSGRSL